MVIGTNCIISIHALLAESDLFLRCGPMTRRYFYPRSPCGERQLAARDRLANAVFLSTLSLRRATINRVKRLLPSWISIHALLAESDLFCVTVPEHVIVFLSTLSLRRATNVRITHNPGPGYFYPRSPCGERRPPSSKTGRRFRYFYPRSPCGERRGGGNGPVDAPHFYPRSPCGERPSRTQALSVTGSISIHALLAESDC